jgi:hypothetical protein
VYLTIDWTLKQKSVKYIETSRSRDRQSIRRFRDPKPFGYVCRSNITESEKWRSVELAAPGESKKGELAALGELKKGGLAVLGIPMKGSM